MVILFAYLPTMLLLPGLLTKSRDLLLPVFARAEKMKLRGAAFGPGNV